MKRNVEIKARAADPLTVADRVARLTGEPPRVLEQDDTFFPCGSGRLKLREIAGERAELIWYDRPDTREPGESRYVVSPCDDPGLLREALSGALGVRGRVRKVRRLHLVGNTRIHLDEVEGLGSFVELEVVLDRGQSVSDGEATAREIMDSLGIRERDLLDVAYIDMLEGSRPGS